eukprot:6550321-Prymnesium_polylepis.1
MWHTRGACGAGPGPWAWRPAWRGVTRLAARRPVGPQIVIDKRRQGSARHAARQTRLERGFRAIVRKRDPHAPGGCECADQRVDGTSLFPFTHLKCDYEEVADHH